MFNLNKYYNKNFRQLAIHKNITKVCNLFILNNILFNTLGSQIMQPNPNFSTGKNVVLKKFLNFRHISLNPYYKYKNNSR